MKSYEELINKHKGRSCFVIGAGPSLWSNMFNPVFSYIHTYGITIAVNSAVLADPVFDYWISTDSLTLRWSWFDLVRRGKGKKVVRSSWIERYKNEIEEFYIFEPRKTAEDEIDFEDSGLMYCNSTSAAIDFSIKLGCKNIFILGLDHCTIDNKHHFWQFFPRNKKPQQILPAQGSFSQQQSVFPVHLQSYKAIKKFAEYKNVKIYNVSYMDTEKDSGWVTKVNVFEIISLNKAEKIIKE